MTLLISPMTPNPALNADRPIAAVGFPLAAG